VRQASTLAREGGTCHLAKRKKETNERRKEERKKETKKETKKERKKQRKKDQLLNNENFQFRQ